MLKKKKVKQSDRHVKSILAACEIMNSFLDSPNQTLDQIVKKTGMSHNRIMRHTGSLQMYGYLYKNPETKIYSLGTMLMSLGKVYESQSNLQSLGQPILQELAHATGESASIHVLENLERVVLARAEGEYDIRMCLVAGQRVSLFGEDGKIGAIGKALLAFESKQTRDNLLNHRQLRKKGLRSSTKLSELPDELDRIQTQGYAFSFGERIQDAAAVVAPIFEKDNHFVGVIAVIGPVQRCIPDTLPKKIKEVVSAAAKLSWKLGGVPSQPSQVMMRSTFSTPIISNKKHEGV